MLKIINSYYYNINNNIYKYLNRVKTMFKTGPMVFVAHLFVTRLVRQLRVKVGETYHYQKKIFYHLTLFLFFEKIKTSKKKNRRYICQQLKEKHIGLV